MLFSTEDLARRIGWYLEDFDIPEALDKKKIFWAKVSIPAEDTWHAKYISEYPPEAICEERVYEWNEDQVEDFLKEYKEYYPENPADTIKKAREAAATKYYNILKTVSSKKLAAFGLNVPSLKDKRLSSEAQLAANGIFPATAWEDPVLGIFIRDSFRINSRPLYTVKKTDNNDTEITGYFVIDPNKFKVVCTDKEDQPNDSPRVEFTLGFGKFTALFSSKSTSEYNPEDKPVITLNPVSPEQQDRLLEIVRTLAMSSFKENFFPAYTYGKEERPHGIDFSYVAPAQKLTKDPEKAHIRENMNMYAVFMKNPDFSKLEISKTDMPEGFDVEDLSWEDVYGPWINLYS